MEQHEEPKQQDDERAVQDMNLSYDGSDLIAWINSNGGFMIPMHVLGCIPRDSIVKCLSRVSGKREARVMGSKMMTLLLGFLGEFSWMLACCAF